MKGLATLLILCYVFSANAQDSPNERRIFFGVNVGTKIANKYYASRYNGTYTPTSTTTPPLVFAINQNTQLRSQIEQLLGTANFGINHLGSYWEPLNMRYSPAFVSGLLAGFKLTPNVQMSLDANFVSLRARDVFTVEVLNTTGTSQPIFELGQLYGNESRFNGKYNIDYLTDGNKAKFVIGLSGIFSAWRIDQHYAIFPENGITIPLFSKHDPNNNITNKTSGIGWGAGINLGVDYRLNEQFVLQLIYQPQHVSLDFALPTTKAFKLQHDIVVRILWK